MIGKKLINTGGAEAAFLPSQHFETVTYTGNGGTQRIGGYINKGAVFNGSSSKIAINSLSLTQTSISLWVNMSNLSKENYVFSFNYNASNSFLFFYNELNNRFEAIDNAGTGSAIALSSTNPITQNQWHHLVLVITSTTTNLYIDGSAETPASNNRGATTFPMPFELGYATTRNKTTAYFEGKIDQVRIFDKALSSDEVTTLYGETAASESKSVTDIFEDNSGVALYQLDGNANDTGLVQDIIDTVDILGDGSLTDYYKLDGTLTNEKSGGTSLQSGSSTFGSSILGQALYLNGGQTASQTSTSYGSMNITGSYTMSCYFKATTGGKRNIIWYVDNIGGRSSIVEFGSDNKLYFGYAGASGAFVSSNTYSANTWYHLAVSFNASTGAIVGYVNGQSIGSGTGNTTTGSTQCFGHGSVGLTGYIDQVRIFNKVISSSEAITLYEKSVPYNGTATNVTYQKATDFQPDLVWIKERTSTSGHHLGDSVRGATKMIYSNLTNAESTDTATITSFDANGFTVGSSGGVNAGTDNYVAWCWKAGGSVTPNNNTVGSITSTVSANRAAGFSVVKYIGSSTSGLDIGHGLSSAPEMVILKNLDSSTSWYVYHKDTGTTSGYINYLRLNDTTIGDYSDKIFYPVDFNASTFIAGHDTVLQGNMIAYCFHSVDGYSKIGSYTGNGSASGPIVETGFEPAFLMIKRSSSDASGGNWIIKDNTRDSVNPNTKNLYANLSASEQDEYPVDFLSNGFQIKETNVDINKSGGTYIYLAIAADPDVTQPTVENSFDVVTYTGNGTTQTINTDFKPDLVWLKSRNNASWVHFLQDSIRGAENFISSNRTDAEGTTTPHIVDSFDTNGFTVLGNGNSNTNGDTYVAWCWKAGDHDDNLPQINTNGTIDSVVSVNPEAGFSIVKWTNTVSESSVGHGLSQKPQLIIAKSTSSSANWIVYTDVIDGSMDYLRLNLSDAKGDSGRTLPNSSVFYFAGDTEDYIAYLFHSVDGYQKIGSYTGNTSGVTVTTGFRPRWIIIKNATAGGDHWGITDSVRNPSGQTTKALFANLANSESDNIAWGVTFTSNGFEVPSTSTASTTYNENGQTFIYLAIA